MEDGALDGKHDGRAQLRTAQAEHVASGQQFRLSLFFEIKIQKILVVIFVTITAALIPSDVLSKSTRNRFSDFRQNIVIEYLNQDFSVLEMKKNADIISSSRVRG